MERHALAVVLNLRGQNCSNVLGVSCKNETLAANIRFHRWGALMRALRE